MKKLFLKILLLFLLVMSAISLPFLWSASNKEHFYESASIDKHKVLESALPPRIIFIGGSNLASGLDSGLVERETGMRTVNMGLHAGLGLRYILSEIKPSLSKGDVVVIITEYEHFFGDYFDGDAELAYFLFIFPESLKYLTSLKQYRSILKNYSYSLRRYLSVLFEKRGFPINSIYSREAFNEHGDLVRHLDKEPRVLSEKEYSGLEGDINKDVIPVLNKFKSYAERRGAQVFLIYPSLAELQYSKNEGKITLLHDLLVKEMKIPVLSGPRDYVFPETYFYDTVYHLTSAGRKARTQKVILDLKKALSLPR